MSLTIFETKSKIGEPSKLLWMKTEKSAKTSVTHWEDRYALTAEFWLDESIFPCVRRSLRDSDWMKKNSTRAFTWTILSVNLSKYEIKTNYSMESANVRYLHTCWLLLKFSVIHFLTHHQLMHKYRTRTLSMKKSIFLVRAKVWKDCPKTVKEILQNNPSTLSNDVRTK